MQYDAFISYSQAADGDLAPAIQRGLQRFAKPWQKRSAMRVFRDATGLSATPDLWDSITAALDQTDWFVLLASPGAAASEWVNKEIEHFLSRRPDARDHILIVVTEGTCEWDGSGFAMSSTCIPRALDGVFVREPLFLDLRWAEADTHLNLRNADFRSVIAGLTSAIRGIPKDELESEDIRIHRTNQRLRRAAVSGLTVLAIALAVAATAAVRSAARANSTADALIVTNAELDSTNATLADTNTELARTNSELDDANDGLAAALDAEQTARLQAEESATISRSREFTARSTTAVDVDPELAALYAIEANYPDGTPDLATHEARDALGVAVRAIATASAFRLPGDTVPFDLIAAHPRSTSVALGIGTEIVVADKDDPRLFDTSSARVSRPALSGRTKFSVPDLTNLAITTSGDTVLVESGFGSGVAAHDAATGSVVWTRPDAQLWAVSVLDHVALDVLTEDGPAIVVVEAASGVEVERILLRPAGTDYSPYVGAVEFSQDGRSIAIAQRPFWGESEAKPGRPLDGTQVLRIRSLRSLGIPTESVAETGEMYVLSLVWTGPDAGPDGADGPFVGALDWQGHLSWFVPATGEVAREDWYDVRTDDVGYPPPTTVTMARDGKTLAFVSAAGSLKIGDDFVDLQAENSPASIAGTQLELRWWDDDTLLVIDEFNRRGRRYRVGDDPAEDGRTPPETLPPRLPDGLRSPDGRWTVRVDAEDGRLGLESSADGRVVQYPIDAYLTVVTWHPDNLLVLGNVDGSIDLLDPVTGATRPVSDPIGRQIGSVSVTPDGSRYFAVGDASEVQEPFELFVTDTGDRLDVRAPGSGGAIVPEADGTGFWVGDGGPSEPRWRFVPDFDPALACRLALPVAGAEFEALTGQPSVCATLPELAS